MEFHFSPLLYFILIFFILSGIVTPLLIELITIHGGYEQSTLLITLPGSIGMCFPILANLQATEFGVIRWNYILFIAVLELFSQAVVLNGLVYAGSALYTVAYSSVTIYTAIFSYLLLGRKLSTRQVVGIATVVIGLAIVSLGAKADGERVVWGVFLVLLGSMSHALTYIYEEYLLVVTLDPIQPEMLCFLLGIMSLSINVLWQLFYTLPNADELIYKHISVYHGNPRIIVLGYIGLTVAAAVHSLCFFKLIREVGSISTGICKGVQSVAVFLGSHVFFCSIQKSQCFTVWKGLSLVIVLVGVYIYSNKNFDQYINRSEQHIQLDYHDSPEENELLVSQRTNRYYDIEMNQTIIHSNDFNLHQVQTENLVNQSYSNLNKQPIINVRAPTTYNTQH